MHLVIAITGASGIKYGIKLLEYLNTRDDINVDLIISKDGMSLIEHECETCLADIAERWITTMIIQISWCLYPRAARNSMR